MVIVSHYLANSLNLTGWADALTGPLQQMGGLGVELFFLLSGFLITSILVREHETTGRVDLKKFYLRRTFRILPAMYAFVLTVAVLVALGMVDASWWEVAAAALFIYNYAPDVGTWWLGHTWSLAVEEQFYLIWPAVVLLLKPRKAIWFCVAGILVVPALRVVTWLLGDEPTRDRIMYMFHARADSLLTGCLLAVVLAMRPVLWGQLQGWVARLHLPAVGLVALIASQVLTLRFGGTWSQSVGFSVENIALAVIFIGALTQGKRLTMAMSWRPLGLVGLISFSLYLWQQLFLTHHNTTILGHPAVALFATFGAALLSYHLVEKPFLRLKKKYETASALVPTERATALQR